jgi:hypothetical protein
MLSLLNTIFTNVRRGGASLVSKILSKLTARADVIESAECVENALDGSANASLVLIPSAYSDGKVHAALPDDGSGDLDFARVNPDGGTRINSQGLVEKVSLLGDELVTNGTFETILGNELVTNGGFDTDISGWNPLPGVLFDFESGDVDGRIGTAKFDANSVNAGRVTQTINTTVGQTYRVSAATKYISGNATHIEVEGLVEYPDGIVISNGLDWKDSFFDFVATSTTHTIAIRERGGDNNASCYVDNISVTSFIEGYIDDTELVTNGGFEDGSSGWNLGTGWSIVDGKAVGVNGDNFLYQSGLIEDNKTYSITYTISNYVSGSMCMRLGAIKSSPIKDSSNINAVGETTFTDILEVSGALNTLLYVRGFNNFTGSIDNISVKEVVQDNWDLGTGWSIEDGVAIVTNATTTAFISQDLGLDSSKTYKVTVNATSLTGTPLYIRNGAVTNSPWYTLGIHTEYVTGGSGKIYIRANTGGSATIDNISVKEVIEEGIPRLNYDDIEYQDVLGAELVSNGDFETGEIGSTNWVENSEPTAPEGSVNGVTYESFAWDNGFTNCVKYGNASNIYHYFNYVLLDATTYTFSFFVQMDDGSEPQIGSGVGNDFRIELADAQNYGSNITKTLVTGSIWRITKTETTVIGRKFNGVRKITNSPKGFRVTGFQLEALPYATSYIPTNGSIQTRLNTTDWDTIPTGWKIENGVATSSGVGASVSWWLRQYNVFTQGKTYKLSVDVETDETGRVGTINDGYNNYIDINNGSGNYTSTFEARGHYLAIAQEVGKTYTVDNISVKEVLGQEVASSGCPSLLLEPQSTNLITYSEDFSQWAVYNIDNLTANQGVSPNGNNDATKIAITTNKAKSTVYKTSTIIGNTTRSVFAKKGSADFMFFDVPHSSAGAWFNLSNGQLGTISSGTATIEDYGNGWYRCSCTANWTSATFAIGLSDADNSTAISGGKDILIWGAQVEDLPYATSYIPTSNGIATRSAETLERDNISHLINSEEGVFYVEVKTSNSSAFVNGITIINTSGLDRIRLYPTNVGTCGILITSSGSLASRSVTISDSSQFSKLAVRYNNGSYSVFVNGNNSLNFTHGTTMNDLNKLKFSGGGSGDPFYGNIKDVRIYKTALTDQELTDLTTQ